MNCILEYNKTERYFMVRFHLAFHNNYKYLLVSGYACRDCHFLTGLNVYQMHQQ